MISDFFLVFAGNAVSYVRSFQLSDVTSTDKETKGGVLISQKKTLALKFIYSHFNDATTLLLVCTPKKKIIVLDFKLWTTNIANLQFELVDSASFLLHLVIPDDECKLAKAQKHRFEPYWFNIHFSILNWNTTTALILIYQANENFLTDFSPIRIACKNYFRYCNYDVIRFHQNREPP